MFQKESDSLIICYSLLDGAIETNKYTHAHFLDIVMSLLSLYSGISQSKAYKHIERGSVFFFIIVIIIILHCFIYYSDGNQDPFLPKL